jgi:hypothetical protein
MTKLFNNPFILFLLILVGIGLFIYFLRFCNRQFRDYIKRYWTSQVISIIAIVFSIVGVYVAYQLNTQRADYVEQRIYVRYLEALDEELILNDKSLDRVQTLKNSIDPYEWNISDDVVRNMISNPMTYKYIGDDMIALLKTYDSYLYIINNFNNYLIAILASSKSLPPENVAQKIDSSAFMSTIKLRAKQARYVGLKLRNQNKLYLIGYKSTGTFCLTNITDIINDLNTIPSNETSLDYKIVGAKNQLISTENMSKDARNKLIQSIDKAYHSIQ